MRAVRVALAPGSRRSTFSGERHSMRRVLPERRRGRDDESPVSFHHSARWPVENDAAGQRSPEVVNSPRANVDENNPAVRRTRQSC